MTEVASLSVSIRADDKDFQRGLNAVDTGLDNLKVSIADKMDAAGKSIAGVGVALTAIGGIALGIGATAVKSFSDSQKAVAQLNAVLVSTGSIAGVTEQHALDLASSLQRVSTQSDEAVLGAQSILLTFTNIGASGGVFDLATKAALDMSQALGSDLQSSSLMVGKALNSPVEGLTALTRAGVSFSESQKTTIKSLVASGKTMEAQQLILSELTRQFGGSAAAAAGTFSGEITIARNRIDDLMEGIGSRLVPVLEIGVGILDDVITGFENMSPAMQTGIAVAVGLGSALALIGPPLIAIGGAIVFAAPLIASATAGITLMSVATALLTSPLTLAAGAFVAFNLASQVVDFNAIGEKIQVGLLGALTDLQNLTGVDFLAVATNVRDTLTNAFNSIFGSGDSRAVANVGEKLGQNLTDGLAGGAKGGITSAIGGNKAGAPVSLAVPTVSRSDNPLAHVAGALADQTDDSVFTPLGLRIADGIKTSINNALATLKDNGFTLPTVDLTPIQTGITNGFQGLDFSNVGPVMEGHFDDILGTIVSVAGIIFGGPIGLAIGAARLVSLAISNNFLGLDDFLKSSGISDTVNTAVTNLKTSVDNIIADVFGGTGGQQGPNPLDSNPLLAGFKDTKKATGPMDLFVSDLKLGFDKLKELGGKTLDDMAPGLSALGTGLQGFAASFQDTRVAGLPRLVTGIGGAIGLILSPLIDLGAKVAGALLTNLGEALPKIGAFISDIVSALSDVGQGKFESAGTTLGQAALDIADAALNLVGIKIDIPNFTEALNGWKTGMDAIGAIVQLGKDFIAGVFDDIAVSLRNFIRDIDEAFLRVRIGAEDIKIAASLGTDTGAQDRKAGFVSEINGIEAAKSLQDQITSSMDAGNLSIDMTKFINVDPAAIAAKITDPTLIQNGINTALAEGDTAALSVLLPVAADLGIDTQALFDQFNSGVQAAAAIPITTTLHVNATVVVDGVATQLNTGGQIAVQSGGAGSLGVAVPSFATDGVMAQTGMAYQHAGERVLNPSDSRNSGGGGGDTHNNNIVINTNDADVLINELKRRNIDLPAIANAVPTY